ncbi:MAG TPA: hypothetical protein VK666_28720, partial [Chryseolinea sp.]|nr:hypothetical protein [Chryseolinea sp.]
MVINKAFVLLAFLCCSFVNTVNSQSEDRDIKLNVLSYSANLQPDVEKKYLRGDVTINFLLDPNINEVIFDSGSLQITRVVGESVTRFVQQDKKLIITLADRPKSENQVQIFYDGRPSRGFILPEPGQAHTLYFTSEWMVCNDAPDDKAKFNLTLLIPADKICIASGTLIKKVSKGAKILYSWSQDYETPSYTFGFVIGSFNKFEAKYHQKELNYYSKNNTSTELETIFSKTGDMLII